MPIIRIDIPEGHSREEKRELHRTVHDAIASTWANQHIWIALREKFTPEGDVSVIITVDLRPGRDLRPPKGVLEDDTQVRAGFRNRERPRLEERLASQAVEHRSLPRGDGTLLSHDVAGARLR